ncbi:hypothetical protein T492DRAFT_835198 [Pavlovales sp. CCMP2436]|nr:hypothetical protein T492DRAFT_835198 [Pavlovales sp. CCMP2436]
MELPHGGQRAPVRTIRSCSDPVARHLPGFDIHPELSIQCMQRLAPLPPPRTVRLPACMAAIAADHALARVGRHGAQRAPVVLRPRGEGQAGGRNGRGAGRGGEGEQERQQSAVPAAHAQDGRGGKTIFSDGADNSRAGVMLVLINQSSG